MRLSEAMNATSATMDPEVSELEQVSLTLLDGEIVWIHVADEVMADGIADIGLLDLVSRLGGFSCAPVREVFEMKRPPCTARSAPRTARRAYPARATRVGLRKEFRLVKKSFLPRLQLVELMDLDAFPGWLRRFQTDFILFSWRLFAPRQEIARQLSALVAGSSSETIVDLCSGSGGLITTIFQEVRRQSDRDLSLVLTDVFPNREVQLAEGISYWPEPVDAKATDRRLIGVRTIFGSFHHFSPEQAREILRDARRGRQPIAVYEMTSRSVRGLLSMVLNVVVGTLLFTPFLRPFSWRRLLSTYAVPLVPLTLLFDGVVSVFRTYTEDEMREMVEGESDVSYEWHSGVLTLGPAPLLYLHGIPRAVSTSRRE